MRNTWPFPHECRLSGFDFHGFNMPLVTQISGRRHGRYRLLNECLSIARHTYVFVPSMLPQIPKRGREEGTLTGNKDAPSLLLMLTRSDPQTIQQKGYPSVCQDAHCMSLHTRRFLHGSKYASILLKLLPFTPAKAVAPTSLTSCDHSHSRSGRRPPQNLGPADHEATC